MFWLRQKIVAKYCTNGLKGFYPNYGFILDSPYDTDDDWRESLRLLISIPQPRTINLYSLTFFAGTKLTEKAITDGYVASLESQFNKKYQDDIKLSYPNTLLFESFLSNTIVVKQYTDVRFCG